MTYEVILQKQPEKYFLKVPKNIAERIRDRLVQLETDPFGSYTKMLKGELYGKWRTRVGSLRIVYTVDEGLKKVNVLLIAPRGDVYK